MTPDLLKRYNALLTFHGTIPYGEYVGMGIFQLRQGKELILPHRTGAKTIFIKAGGMDVPMAVPVYEMLPQLRPQDAERWVIAKWMNPTEEEWDRTHEGAVDWPKHGYLYCFYPFDTHQPPREEQIKAFIDHIEYQKSLTAAEHLEKVVAQGEKPFSSYTQNVSDIMDAHFTDHLLGKRGGNYLAFNEPGNKPPRSSTPIDSVPTQTPSIPKQESNA